MTQIPNKSTFKFQELTPITGVKSYVIRYWETEFPEISPVDGDAGQKLYSRKDVETILKIKKLLFEDKVTMLEAKTRLQDSGEIGEVQAELAPEFDFSHIRSLTQDGLSLIQDIKRTHHW